MSLSVSTVWFAAESMRSTAGMVGCWEGVFIAITLRAVDEVFEIILVTLFYVDVGVFELLEAVGVFVF